VTPGNETRRCMQSDAVKFDVCVIGAGPVGIASALRLATQGLSVALTDSGSEKFDAAVQGLSDAEILNTQSHAQMKDSVRRVLGGTSHLWGGRCGPLDPLDFVSRPQVPLSGWPLAHHELDGYHQEASVFLGAGPAHFSTESCLSLATAGQPLSAQSRDTAELSFSRLERWSGEPNAWVTHAAAVLAHPKKTILSGWTCTGFHASELQGHVQSARFVASTAPGVQRTILARHFVVACGGIESTRLMLHTMQTTPQLVLEGARHVGKYYMGHPSGKIADIQLYGDPRATLYGFERDGDTYVRRRLTFTDAHATAHSLINIAFWLDNPPPADPVHGSGVLSSAYLAMTTPVLWKFLAPAAIRDRLVGSDPVRRMPHLLNCLRSPLATASFCVRFVHDRYIKRPRLPGFFTYSASNRYTLHYHAEQRPREDSCITLGDEVDAAGMRRARIALRWGDDDLQDVVRAHQELDQLLRKHQIGELQWRYPPEALCNAVKEQAIDGFHQVGTLRMARSPSEGVTDMNGRFFGIHNLFAATSAVFPTAGQANPTLTAVALALRQADFIAQSAS
jgi:choline dehydrogenase-like flavoprotein